MGGKLGSKLKSMIDGNSIIIRGFLWLYNHIPFNNSLHTKGSSAKIECSMLKKSAIKCIGKNNSISIKSGTRLINCRIHIEGDNNRVVIGNYAYLNGVEIWIEDSNNIVTIGTHCSFQGNVHLACIEGTAIEIGEDCMFSANITLRTGDSHSITDLEGNRINPSNNISVGNHVWVGNSVIITKGVIIRDKSVVGTGSVVTRKFDDGNIVIAGNPARVVKSDISWERQRLLIETVKSV